MARRDLVGIRLRYQQADRSGGRDLQTKATVVARVKVDRLSSWSLNVNRYDKIRSD